MHLDETIQQLAGSFMASQAPIKILRQWFEFLTEIPNILRRTG